MKNKLFLTLLLGILLVGLIYAFNWADSNIAYWDMQNTTILDLTGNGFSATNSGAVAVTGKIGDALDFETTESDYAYVADNPSLNPAIFSVSVWIKEESVVNDAGIFSKGTAGADILQLAETSGGGLRFHLATTTGGYDTVDSGVISTGEWHHIVFKWDGEEKTIWIDGVLNVTDTTGSGNYTGSTAQLRIGRDIGTNYFDGVIDEIGFWNKNLTKLEIEQLYNGGYGLQYLSETTYSTNITLISPENNSLIYTEEKNFTANLTITGLNENNYTWKNITYNIWNKNGTLFNQTTVNLSPLNQTNSTLSISNLNIGNYVWGTSGCYGNSTYSNCTLNLNGNFSFTASSNVISSSYNTTSYETASESYSINISTFNSLTPTNAKINWNGTNYTAVISSIAGNNYSISYSKIIPLISAQHNITFKFYWSIDSTVEISSIYNQTINSTVLSICNATYTTPFINFTFKDESNSSNITASIPTSTFVYWLGDGTVNKTLTYINNSENSNYTFCFFPTDKNVNVDIRMQYEGTDYPQRIYNPLAMMLNSTLTSKILYLLSTSNGQYVTFQVINLAEQTISNVEMNATREISGSDVIVGQGTTGDDGTVTLWLNPNFIHSFGFSKIGITTLITSFAPTQTSYTISMNTGTTVTDNDYVKGISIQINPTQTYLLNGTTYNFNMTLNSSYWNVSLFGFTLEDINGNNLGNVSSTAGNGTVSANWNTSNYTKVYMKYYYVINGTYTNYTRTWTIYDYESGNGFGILTFFTDLKSYFTTGDGLFGSTEFALAIITFLAIFLITGVFTYQFGISSPATISGLIFGLILFFDVGVGLLPNVNDNHAITLIMAIITIALFAREVSK